MTTGQRTERRHGSQGALTVTLRLRGLPSDGVVPMWSPTAARVDLEHDRSAEREKPSDLVFKPVQRALSQPSGRQDSNLRPLDPQSGPQRTFTCRSRESPVQHTSIEDGRGQLTTGQVRSPL